MLKPRLGTLSSRTVALMGVNILLLAIVGLRALQGTAVDEVLSVAPEKVVIEPLAVVGQPPSDPLDTLKTKALFHSTRSFYIPPPPAPVQQLPPQPDYRLVGAIIAPQKPITAMLSHNQSKKSVKVRVGDDLEGWTIETVEAKRVVAKLGEERFEINSTSIADRQSFMTSPATTASSNAGFTMRPNISRRTSQPGPSENGPNPLHPPSAPAANQDLVNARPGVKVLSGKSAPETSSASMPQTDSVRTYNP